jgi:response regulator of citrate/malate metabolism
MDQHLVSVLVVDDDFRVAAVHAGFVERVGGFRVVGEAHSVAGALERIELLRPELVLLDLYLPDGNGLDLIRTMLRMPQPPVVVVISAANDVASVRASLQLGAVSYLVKPFSFADLSERLIAFRDEQSQIAELRDEATQADIDRIFGMRRAASVPARPIEGVRLAPTLRLVHDAVSASEGTVSASDVAAIVGISRATAQRYLTQLEQSGELRLELRYGATGRPEHRYSLRRRSPGSDPR